MKPINRKVTYQTLGGALAALAIGTLHLVDPSLEFPAGYEAALAVVFGAIVGYFTHDGSES